MADDGEKQSINTLSVGQIAQFCDRSTQWVQQLAKDGFIAKEAHGRYKLVSVVRGVIAYYEDLQAKSNKAAAANRATDARTREIELRIKERSRVLIAVEDARAVVGEMAAAVRSEFQGIAARYTRDMQERRRLEQEIDGAFERLSRRTTEADRALATGQIDMEAEPEA
jgi:hypothetical protein